jgi:hypothetical protein
MFNETNGIVPGFEKEPFKKIERITSRDLAYKIPPPDETVFILQRNGKDNRDSKSELEMGALIPGSAEQIRFETEASLKQALESLEPEERKQVDFLVIAADTELETPMEDVRSTHKRAVETAERVLAGIEMSIQEHDLDRSQLLNKRGLPIELSSGRLRDLRMFEDTPEFVKFLKDKYGTGMEFWQAYEDDVEKETREKMGAEGPDEIAKRIDSYLKVLANAMKFYHVKHPNRRVMIWVETHYDTLSPFFKSKTGMKKTDDLPVDHGAGVAIYLGKDGKATSQIQGHSYEFSFSKEVDK